jgi:hypothetical protein
VHKSPNVDAVEFRATNSEVGMIFAWSPVLMELIFVRHSPKPRSVVVLAILLVSEDDSRFEILEIHSKWSTSPPIADLDELNSREVERWGDGNFSEVGARAEYCIKLVEIHDDLLWKEQQSL